MSLFQIVSIPDDNNNLHEALGLSEKRCKELCDHLESCHKNDDNKKISEVLEQATSICDNINETAYLCFHLGAIDNEYNRRKEAHDMMERFFKEGPLRFMFGDEDDG